MFCSSVPRLAAAACLIALPTALAVRVEPTTAAITVADLRSRLFRIADDSMLGRETGSRGASLTASYVAAEFQRLGLQPRGEAGGWYQVVPFWVAAPAGQPLRIVGGGTLRAEVDYIIPGVAGASPTGPVDIIYGGDAADAATWIDATQSAGKVVLLDVRPGASGRAELPQPNAALRSPRFAGAVAVAVARLDLMAPAAIATALRAVPRPDTARAAAVPAQFWVTSQAADQLLGAPVASAKPGAVGRRIQGEMTLRWQPVAFPARNVIGLLPGSDPALRGQYVSLTAHNDHVGVCSAPVDHDSTRAFLTVLRPMGLDTRTWNETPDAFRQINTLLGALRKVNRMRADSICNGADDDGSGTVALLELAEALASMPVSARPKRSILFVSHTGEERGLSGSKWFTDHPTVPLDSIVAEIDEDMIGRGAVSDLPKGGPTYLEVIGARRLSSAFGDMLEAANAAQQTPFVFNYEFDAPGHPLQYYCRADHYSYARYGIPSVAFSRGEHMDYHQVTDEPQYINYIDMQRVVTMVHDAALKIANTPARPALDRPRGDPKARCVQ